MDDWIEDDGSLLGDGDGDGDRASRVLDQRMIREPIRLLNPRAPLTLPPDASCRDAIDVMREHRVGCVLVEEGGRLIGILTERDLLLKLEQGDVGRAIRHLMTPDPEALDPDAPIVYALNKMSVGGFRHVPLVDEAHRPVGIVSVKDIIDYIVDFFPNDVLTIAPDALHGERWHGRDGG
jgi:CBS domain-containing protein